jgi:hypothetical protein
MRPSEITVAIGDFESRSLPFSNLSSGGARAGAHQYLTCFSGRRTRMRNPTHARTLTRCLRS